MNLEDFETTLKVWIGYACRFVTENWAPFIPVLLVVLLLASVALALFCPGKIEFLIKRCGENISARAKKYPWLSSSMVSIFAVIVLICFHEWIKGNAIILGGIIAVASLLLLGWRTYSQAKQVENQGRTLDHQMAKEVDDRFIAAVGLLGNAEASARTGAIYSLYQLVVDDKDNKYRPQIAQILCSHIRTTTQDDVYKNRYDLNPSDEIQTTIDLLFRDISGNKGIYCRDDIIWQENFPLANLKHAFLQGADFENARCEGADFSYSQCRAANFSSAHCERARFSHAHCEAGYFHFAHCWEANFYGAYCVGSEFRSMNGDGSIFSEAHCEGAGFSFAYCRGASFRDAYCAGAIFSNAYFQCADFSNTHCQGAFFEGTNFRGSYALRVNRPYRSGSRQIEERASKKTELENVIFAGRIGEESIKAIDETRRYFGEDFLKSLLDIVEKNKDKAIDNKPPQSIESGVPEDIEELKDVIHDLERLENLFKNRVRHTLMVR